MNIPKFLTRYYQKGEAQVWNREMLHKYWLKIKGESQ